MSECDISKDRTWVGQYHCGIHGVWFRAESEPTLCPAGDVQAERDEARADALLGECIGLRASTEHWRDRATKLDAELQRYSVSAGWADQYKNEARFVRERLGFGPESEAVSPSDLIDAIAKLEAERDEALSGEHGEVQRREIAEKERDEARAEAERDKRDLDRMYEEQLTAERQARERAELSIERLKGEVGYWRDTVRAELAKELNTVTGRVRAETQYEVADFVEGLFLENHDTRRRIALAIRRKARELRGEG